MDTQLAITPEEAAKRLSIGRSTIYKLIAAGEIPARRLGRRLVVPVRALERLLDEETAA